MGASPTKLFNRHSEKLTSPGSAWLSVSRWLTLLVFVLALAVGASSAIAPVSTTDLRAMVRGVGGSVSATTPASGISVCKVFSQGTCTGAYADSTNVTLTATASAGYTLLRWEDLPGNSDVPASCKVTPTPTTCTINNGSSTMKNVVAVFTSTTLDVQPITWDYVGIDSNAPETQGPNRAPVGARVCNRAASTIANVSSALTWDSANPYITSAGPLSYNLGSLASGACSDVYFQMEFTRTTSAIGASRNYRITAVGSDSSIGSTPGGRRLTLQALASASNEKSAAIVSNTGCTDGVFYAAPGGGGMASTTCQALPTTLVIGQQYQFRYYFSAANYTGFSTVLLLDPSMFRVKSVQTTWQTPAATVFNSPFADGCGIQSDPLLANYLNYGGGVPGCLGPRNVVASGCSSGNGNNRSCGTKDLGYSVVTVVPIAPGSTSVRGAVFDPGHYNSDVLDAAKSIVVANKWPLSVTVGAGGTVASDVGGISCTSAGGTCSASYADGTTVTLTQTPNAGQTFQGWGGACTGTGTTCTVNMSQAWNVSAYYGTSAYALTVSPVGDGTGTVTSDTGGISCSVSGGTCVATYAYNTSVTLTQAADPLMIFTGWSGDTSGAQAGTCTESSTTCVVSMAAARTIRAVFEIDPELTVTVSGTGTVTSSSGGINCGNGNTACVGYYALNATVTLTETPGAGTSFTGWGGACSGSASTCVVTMDVVKSVTATFSDTTNYPLAVNRSGTGSGLVASNPAGINCGDSCAATYASGTSVTLTATADSGSRFAGWGGACTGVGTCTVTMSTIRSVTASFTATYTLSVSKSGSGAGTVTSADSPQTINCGSTCSAIYDTGTSITLTATAISGSVFTGWSGGTCSGVVTTCTVTMNQIRFVTATFQPSWTLTATQAGSGSVSSSPSGITLNAAGSTSASYEDGTSVTLTATPASGWRFDAWSGATCAGGGPATACTVAMSQARSVTATFVQQYVLTATQVGSGGVSSSPSGITLNAAGSTSASYDTGTSVTLTATPASGWRFDAWSGATCAGGGPATACTVTTSQARSVTATFVEQYVLTATQVGSGGVSSSPSGVTLNAAGSTSASYDTGTSVTLTATPASGWRIGAWTGDTSGATSGCTTGSATCVVPMSQARSVTATFVQQYVLTAIQVGSGGVSSSVGGINLAAPGSAQATLDTGTSVTLTATAASGWGIGAWTGDTSGATSGCTTGSATCVVPMSAARSITQTFIQIFTLSATQVGSGGVSSSVGGINLAAPGSAQATIDTGTSVTLTATPASGWRIGAWTGDTSGATSGCTTGSATCVVPMSAARSITQTFIQIFTLSATQVGSGGVSSSVGGINLAAPGSQSSTPLDTGTSVTLTATPASGWRIGAWTGDTSGATSGCTTGSATCVVPMSQARSVTATFVQQYVLTAKVVSGGSAGAAVTSAPSGISGCTSASPGCTATYDTGTSVEMTRTAAASGYHFAGWSGNIEGASTGTCTATSTTCEVPMSAVRVVTATYAIDGAAVLGVSVTGGGTVTSSDSPPGINTCADGGTGTCLASYSSADAPGITLTRTAPSGWRFVAWGGACTGDALTCSVTMSTDRVVTATYTRIWDLTVNVTGDGSGASVSAGGTPAPSSGSISSCTASGCVATYDDGQSVTLTRTAASAGYRFTGWSGGGCSGTGTTCVVPIGAATAVSATYVAVETLTVNVTSGGAGRSVTATGGTVTTGSIGTCAGTGCQATYDKGDVVTLTRTTAPAGYRFDSWGGACGSVAATATTCGVTMSAATTASATYVQTRDLAVSVIGGGVGRTVSSAPGSINVCEGDGTAMPPAIGCLATFDNSTAVVLSRPSDASLVLIGYRFTGWSGGTTGATAGTCTATSDTCATPMTENRNITATFIQIFTLSATQVGNGTVSSSPSGITLAVAGTTTHDYDAGTSVTVTATPASGWRFDAWSGATCAGGGPATACTVTMSQARSVTATFVRVFALSVSRIGSGTGSVASSPAGISCGSTCAHDYDLTTPTATTATLTATAGAGSHFNGWSGEGCSGTSTCTVTMSQARAVVADFTFTPLAITPTSHDFGTIDIDAGPATTQMFTVSNPSDGTVTTGVVGIIGPASSSMSRLMGFSGGVPMVFGLNGFAPTSAVDQFALTNNTCSNISLAPGASCTATAGFDPAFTGPASALINVPSNVYPDPTQARLVGIGVTAKWTLRGGVVGGGSVSATSGGTRTNLTGCTSAGGVSCVGYITRGGTARLVPEPEVGWVFDGWSGDLGSGECTDRAACVVTMTSDRTITARFVRSWTLTAAVGGAGNGTVDATVNGAPSGVTGCSSSSGVCSADYNDGTIVTLTATPASGSTVAGWSGDCVGAAATCVVTMSQARMVQATFALGARALGKAGLTVTLKATRTTFVSRQKGVLNMTATNTTSEDLTYVTFVIHVPNGFVVLSATGARITRYTVTWTGLRLARGQSVTRGVQVMALGTRHRRKSPAVAKGTAPTTASSTAKRVLVVRPLPPRKQGLVTG